MDSVDSIVIKKKEMFITVTSESTGSQDKSVLSNVDHLIETKQDTDQDVAEEYVAHSCDNRLAVCD